MNSVNLDNPSSEEDLETLHKTPHELQLWLASTQNSVGQKSGIRHSSLLQNRTHSSNGENTLQEHCSFPKSQLHWEIHGRNAN